MPRTEPKDEGEGAIGGETDDGERHLGHIASTGGISLHAIGTLSNPDCTATHRSRSPLGRYLTILSILVGQAVGVSFLVYISDELRRL
jgi:hypothetical protein